MPRSASLVARQLTAAKSRLLAASEQDELQAAKRELARLTSELASLVVVFTYAPGTLCVDCGFRFATTKKARGRCGSRLACERRQSAAALAS